MRIEPNQQIAGIPILTVRRLLRSTGPEEWGIDFLEKVTRLARKRARLLVAALIEEGFIEAAGVEDDIALFRTTSKGLALASAKAAAPVRRTVADSVLEAFLRRVAIVNTSREYLYRVHMVVLFGSYLTGADPVGDIDLAIELRQQEWAQQQWEDLARARRRVAREAGRRFSSFIDKLFWPEREVQLFLKSRSRTLSIVDLETHKRLFTTAPFEVLVGDKAWVPEVKS